MLQFAREKPTERWAGDINAAVRKAIDLTALYAKERGGTIETSLDTALPPVVMNPLEIEQALVNLINNAIEAAPAAPRVVISSCRSSAAVRLKISDNGRGMTRQTHSHMFDPFFTTRRDEGGTGLGLSLVYGIISDHGGTVEAITNHDQGITVVVEIPIQPAATISNAHGEPPKSRGDA